MSLLRRHEHAGVLFFQMEPAPASLSVPVEAEAPAAALGEREQRSALKQEEEPMEQEEEPAPRIQEEAGDTVTQVVQIDNKHVIDLDLHVWNTLALANSNYLEFEKLNVCVLS